MKLLLWMLLVGTAQAQTGDWARLEGLKPGATLVVETDVTTFAPPNYDRCRLIAVDRKTLSCALLGSGHARLVFPAEQIDAVYHVRHKWVNVPAFLGLGTAGMLVGGLVSGYPPALALGLLGSVIWGIVAAHESSVAAWRGWNGIPENPLPAHENRELLYVKPGVSVRY